MQFNPMSSIKSIFRHSQVDPTATPKSDPFLPKRKPNHYRSTSLFAEEIILASSNTLSTRTFFLPIIVEEEGKLFAENSDT